jgi:protein ImuB
VLWIALHLPSLSLESFAATLAARDPAAPPPPLALMDAHRIVAADDAAQALGVKPGLKRATALALAPRLVLGRADPARDRAALEPVAHAALAYTPSVIVPPADAAEAAPHTVLLEVAASLRCFGGRPRLLNRLLADVAPLGHRLHVAVAPTAQGAALLARAQPRCDCPDPASLAHALDAVPVWLLGPGRAHWEALEGMGLRSVGDLRSLPRTGLARRFGDALLLELDRAFGTEPDPREPITLPASFESRLELFARADCAEQLLHGAGVLFDRLVPWLSARHAFLRCATLEMRHEPRWRTRDDVPRATCLELALAEPSRDRGHLLALLRERLGRLALPAPTLDLVLRADEVVGRAAPNAELFPAAQAAQVGLVQLVERLQARLGPEHVQRLEPVEDHRPEQACRAVSAAAQAPFERTTIAWPVSGGRPVRAGHLAGAAATQPGAIRPRSGAARKRIDAMRKPAASSPRDAASTPGAAPEQRSAAKPLRAAAAVAADAVNAQKRRPPAPPKPRAAMPRPVWLLPEPLPLPEQHARPLLDGAPLQLVSGPERIESGWWDTTLAERDYFIAQAADGALVWIYRARLPLSASGDAQGWFLQGRFG